MNYQVYLSSLNNKLWMLVILLGAFYQSSTAQVNCNISMACNDTLHIALEASCMTTITSAMMMEDMQYTESDYTVKIKRANGAILPGNILNADYLGEYLEVSVYLNDCGNSCWGVVWLEDKSGPLITNCRDTSLTCSISTDPGVHIPFPTFMDPCFGPAQGTYKDMVEIRPCADTLSSIITRTWTATDDIGNTSTCVQLINVVKESLDSTVFPPNYDGLDEDFFECGELLPYQLLDNGAPSPEVSGYPSGISCEKIQYHYQDLIFDICGESIKVLRQWTLIDWCTGQDTSGAQIIKVMDTTAPVCTPDKLATVIPTDDHKCTATYMVPDPQVIDCSDYTYTVGYTPYAGPLTDIYEDVIYHEINVNQNGKYTINELPKDTSFIVYSIEDACGYKTQCYDTVIVRDHQVPVAICEGYTVVTLNNRGEADMYAESLDDHSWDNCAIDSFAIRRETDNCGIFGNTSFRKKIDFCCEDTRYDYIMVTLRVYDVHGNYNDCRAQVRVQDKQLPQIECPIDVTINCEEDIDNLTLTGTAIAYDNCEVSLDYEDNISGLNDCGIGTVIRTWSAKDQFGNTASCVQRITIRAEYEFTDDFIKFPKDVTLNGCDSRDADPEGLAGIPTVDESPCMNVAISYSDQKFYNVEGACVKILRTWKVTDWCTFNPDQPFYYTHVQLIKLINEVPPSFVSGCSDRTEVAEICIVYVDLEAHAVDDCTRERDIRYWYNVDFKNDGDYDRNGLGNDASGNFETGKHKIVFYAQDECGNIDSCDFILTIEDVKPPTPICFGEVTWVLDDEGKAEVWASDFDLKSTDGCTSEKNLYFSFNEAGTLPAMNFDCSDLDNGIAAEIPLQMWVIDESGNRDNCSVILVLQDNAQNACLDDPDARASVTGMIRNEAEEGLEEVEVIMNGSNAESHYRGITDAKGAFGFGGVRYYQDYMLSPYKNDDILNGVSTLDLVMIQQYVLGIRNIDSPYKLIAADINGDMRISAADLIELRKVILGIHKEFPGNTSWKFIPGQHEFANPDYPWDYNQEMMLEGIMMDQDEKDFVAVKIGDINGSAITKARREELQSRSLSERTLMISSKVINGSSLLTFRAEDITHIYGMQFTLDLGQSHQFSAVKSGVMDVTTENFGQQVISQGVITFSWGKNQPLDVTGQELFSILIKGQVDINDIQLGSDITSAEAYDEDYSTYSLILKKEVENHLNDGMVLYQNKPNPFDHQTEIGFYLPTSELASLRIFDVSGKELYRMSKKYEAGLHRIIIDRSMLPVSGLLYYQLEAGDQSHTKKMIIFE